MADEVKGLSHCAQCGAAMPFLKSASVSITSLVWSCSTVCYDIYIDSLIEAASPDVEYIGGAGWDEMVEKALEPSAPSLRQQMHNALDKFEREFSPGEQ